MLQLKLFILTPAVFPSVICLGCDEEGHRKCIIRFTLEGDEELKCQSETELRLLKDGKKVKYRLPLHMSFVLNYKQYTVNI